MSDLYTLEGWPNIKYIDDLGCWLNILISPRQVGKTFNVLKYMLDENRFHLFTRRTTHELEMISSNPLLSPYEKFKNYGHNVMFSGRSDMMEICGYDLNEKGERVKNDKQYGLATSLKEIAAVRGFNGDPFSDWIFDEFIPEKIVVVRKAEGDAFLNAHTTLNANRELEGRPPIKTWLLANTNNINSPILNSLNIIDDILYARRKDKEEYITDNGVFIGQFKSEKILSKRKDTALMRQIGKDNDFYGMAIENRFAYDESPYVKTMSLKGMQPLWSYNDKIFCWQRQDSGMYICKAPGKVRKKYGGSRTDRERLALEWSIMRPYYYAAMINFSDLRTLSIFKSIFNIT